MAIELNSHVEANRNIPSKGISKGDKGIVTDIQNDGGDDYLYIRLDKRESDGRESNYSIGPSCENCWDEVIEPPVLLEQKTEEGFKRIHVALHVYKDRTKEILDRITSIQYKLSILSRFVFNLIDPEMGYVVNLLPGELDDAGNELPSGLFVIYIDNGGLHLREADKLESGLKHNTFFRLNNKISDTSQEVPPTGA